MSVFLSLAVLDESREAPCQVWMKALTGGRVAAFLLSNGAISDKVLLHLADLGFDAGARVSVRDVWNHTYLASVRGTFVSDSFGGHDSRFYIFSTESDSDSVLV